MPLLRFNIRQGRSDSEIKAMLDSAHATVVQAFRVPERDRYQIVDVHSEGHMIMQDSGLGIERSSGVVLIEVTSRRRSTDEKQEFFRLLAANLERDCGIKPSDVMITITENDNANWSFSDGRAQFLTGEL